MASIFNECVDCKRPYPVHNGPLWCPDCGGRLVAKPTRKALADALADPASKLYHDTRRAILTDDAAQIRRGRATVFADGDPIAHDVDVSFSISYPEGATSSMMDAINRAAARYGFKTTTREDPMPPTTNPYDRRDRAPAGERRMARIERGSDERPYIRPHTGDVVGLAMEPRLGDLSLFAEAVAMRVEREVGERYRRDAEESLLEARRVAWEEGREAGGHAGAANLIERIDEQFGGKVREKIDRLTQVVNAQDQTGRAARAMQTRAALTAELDEARTLLRELVEAHHKGFAEEMPF